MADLSVATAVQDAASTAAPLRASSDKGSDAERGHFSNVLQKAGDQQPNGAGKARTATRTQEPPVDPETTAEEAGSGTLGTFIPKSSKVQVFSIKAGAVLKTDATGNSKAGDKELPDLAAKDGFQLDRTDGLKPHPDQDAKDLAASAGKPDGTVKTGLTGKAAAAEEKKTIGGDKKADADDQKVRADDEEPRSNETSTAIASQIAANPASDMLGLLSGAALQTAANGAVQHPQARANTETKAGSHTSSSRAVAAVDEKAAPASAMEMVSNALTPPSEAAEMMPTDETADTDNTTFRLSRADGRGGTLDLNAASGATEKATSSRREDAAVENVTVVDSRRYIGLAGNTNSATVTAALAGDHEWAHAMRPESSLSNAAQLSSTGQVVNTLKIQMNPIDLGLVTATMRLSGETLSVDLKVETHEAYRQMKADHDKIVESLRGQGYAVDNVTVTMTAPIERSDSGGQAGSQSQSGQQQTLQQQGQGSQYRDRQGNAPRQPSGGFDGQSRVGGEASGVDVSDRASGGVYL